MNSIIQYMYSFYSTEWSCFKNIIRNDLQLLKKQANCYVYVY